MNDLDCFFFASPDTPISHKLAYQCHIICCRSNGAADDGHDGEADEHPAGDLDGDEVAGQLLTTHDSIGCVTKGSHAV